MISPPTKTQQIFKGQRIAQLILLPYYSSGQNVTDCPRGKKGFGSSGLAFWVQEISGHRPFKILKIEGKEIKGLIDTGADVSCIAGKDWPSSWPSQQTPTSLIGLGTASSVARSSQILGKMIIVKGLLHLTSSPQYLSHFGGEMFYLKWESYCTVLMKRSQVKCYK